MLKCQPSCLLAHNAGLPAWKIALAFPRQQHRRPLSSGGVPHSGGGRNRSAAGRALHIRVQWATLALLARALMASTVHPLAHWVHAVHVAVTMTLRMQTGSETYRYRVFAWTAPGRSSTLTLVPIGAPSGFVSALPTGGIKRFSPTSPQTDTFGESLISLTVQLASASTRRRVR